MKKSIFVIIAFLCIQQVEAAKHNQAQKNVFKRIISLVESPNGVSPIQEDTLKSLQEEYENICVVCGDAIGLKDACKKLTISCVDKIETLSCEPHDASLDLVCEECPESTFIFSVHKACEPCIGKYLYLRKICNMSPACKTASICCIVGSALFVIAASCAYVLM